MAQIDKPEILRRCKILSRINPTSEAAQRTRQHVRQSILTNNTRKRHDFSGLWNSFTKRRITPVAAALLAAGFLGLMFFLPDPPDESVTSGDIPLKNNEDQIASVNKELFDQYAQLPLERLLDMHFKETENNSDKKAVAAALKIKLDQLSPDELLAVAQQAAQKNRTSPTSAGQVALYRQIPLSHAIEAADLTVRAKAVRVAPDTDEITYAILNRYLGIFEDVFEKIPVTIQLHIIETFGSSALAAGDDIFIDEITTKIPGRINIEEGREYIIALKEHDGKYYFSANYRDGLYPVDTDNGTVDLRAGETGSLRESMVVTLEQVRPFIRCLQNSIYWAEHPAERETAGWLDLWQSDILAESWMAVEYFNTLPAPAVEPAQVLDAFERQYQQVRSFIKENPPDIVQNRKIVRRYIYERKPFFNETLDLLIRIADEPAIDKMLALFEDAQNHPVYIFGDDFQDYRASISRLTRLILRMPGPQRYDRIVRLLRLKEPEKSFTNFKGYILPELRSAEGEDIDRLLWDMIGRPGDFDLYDNPLTLVTIWNVLAQKGRPEFGIYLEQYLADPENIDLGVSHYRGDPRWAVGPANNALNTYIRQTADSQKILAELIRFYDGENQGAFYFLINTMDESLEPNDTRFIGSFSENITNHWRIPKLIAEMLPHPSFIPALREALKKEVTGFLLEALYACGEQEEAIILALEMMSQPYQETDRRAFDRDLRNRADIILFLGTTGDASLVDVIEPFIRDEYMDELRKINTRLENPFDFAVNKMQQNAVLAWTRLAGDSAVPRLRQLYMHEDIFIRILAALSLYYLGDDSGYELLNHFVNHTQRFVPEIDRRWSVDLSGGRSFQDPILYLQSPRTDELLVQRLHRDLDTSDRSVFDNYYFRKYWDRILPFLLEHLDSPDRNTRQNAHTILKNLTHQDFGYQPDRFAGQQDEIIQRWRTYIYSEVLQKNNL